MHTASTKKSGGCLKTLLIILATALVSILVTIWIMNIYIFPKRFDPVTLSQNEQQQLTSKLENLESVQSSADKQTLGAEKYSEDNSKREIFLTERELNGLLNQHSELGETLLIDLSNNLASAKLIAQIPADFPFLGGKTLRASAGVELSYANARPIVALQGVSVWGVPIPNAWLGGIKNIDLVSEFGTDEGFWKAFADGVELIEVEDGQLKIKLKE